MNIYFGENLKGFRENKGLTQSNLAELLGVSFQTVSKWERGNTYSDITLLPVIADFFGVSVDTLLGVNKIENERKANEYIELFDNAYFTDSGKLIEEFEKAIGEFPNDFRILVRYMELIIEAKDHPFIKLNNDDASNLTDTNNPFKLGFIKNPEYEEISHKIQSIYDAIQNHCIDDNIRICSKRLMIRHLMIRYELSFDEKTEKWRCDIDALKKAQHILSTLPAISDTKECLALEVNNDLSAWNNNFKETIEELLFQLQGFLRGYIHSDENISAEDKIEQIRSVNKLLEIVEKNDSIGKNEIHLMLNYGQLSYLYSQICKDDEAVDCLEKCIKTAIKLDDNPTEMERIARFYNLEKPLITGSMCGRMKKIIMENYPYTESFRADKRFIELLKE